MHTFDLLRPSVRAVASFGNNRGELLPLACETRSLQQTWGSAAHSAESIAKRAQRPQAQIAMQRAALQAKQNTLESVANNCYLCSPLEGRRLFCSVRAATRRGSGARPRTCASRLGSSKSSASCIRLQRELATVIDCHPAMADPTSPPSHTCLSLCFPRAGALQD